MTEMMVQKLISQRQAEQKPNSAKNRMPKPSDYEKFQVNATAYEAKGHLVHTPLWKAPVVAVEDLYQNIKNVGQGLKGKSNDHELGQMNDLAMRAGGLALAGYLATTRMLPAKKGMEFVGFASFFASMILFPKLFINAPIKAMYGFDWDQKYVDSYGRKKPFHMDPQYTPYDLYAPEKLEAIGDKMGVDQDMENRQDFIKRKMTKIATQANTIWMLTAGLATPIMSALISSGVEKGLNEAQKIRKTNQVNKNLKNVDTIANKRADKKGLEALGKFLSVHKDKPVNEEFVSQLMKLVDKGNSLKIENTLKMDLKKILSANNTQNIAEFLGDIEIKVPETIGSETMISHTFTKENIEKCLTGGKKNLNNIAINVDTIDDIKNRLVSLFKSETKHYDDELIPSLNQAFTNSVNAKLKKPPIILTRENIDAIEDIFKALDSFKIKKNILSEYILHRIVKKEDSVMARQWKKTAEGIMNVLGFSDEELKQMKKAPAKAREVMEAKMTEIATDKDDTKYKKVLGDIAELINKFDEAIEQGVSKESKKGFRAETEEIIGKFYGDFALKARGLSLDTVADYVAGNTSKEYPLHASATKNSIEAVDNSLMGAKNTLYKVIQGFDVLKRLEKAKTEEGLSDNIVAAIKYAIMDSTYGDHFVKLHIVEPENYKKVAGHLFSQELDSSTMQALGSDGNKNLLAKFQKQMSEVQEQLGDAFYRFGNKHVISSYEVDKYGNKFDKDGKEIGKVINIGDLKKQTKLGDSLSGLAQKTAEGMYNTKYWQKMFGGIGAVVAAVALISPLFFGKMEAPEKKEQKEVTNNG